MTARCALVAILVLMLGAACTAQLPLAPVPSDRAAKTFRAPPGLSAIYVYGSARAASLYDVTLDGRWQAVLGPGTFLMRVVEPGRHSLFAEAPEAEFTPPVPANLVMTTRPDGAYFIRVDLPVWTSGSRVSLGLAPREVATHQLVRDRLLRWSP